MSCTVGLSFRLRELGVPRRLRAEDDVSDAAVSVWVLPQQMDFVDRIQFNKPAFVLSSQHETPFVTKES